MDIENPIPADVRGRLYVAAIIFGSVATVATAVLTVLGLGLWVGVVGVASGAFLTLASTLARANLTVSPDPDPEPVLEEADAITEG